ncbi:ERF family protein [Solidesulfovibrio alcoholivorans]|uniref:ERF family protein n=1 Tax=Solidesulfovibrio alcoholivorans TaxID=81406 RepID=UPI0004969001|nr:ERF family protein [Solidesulfovibrio alcoholivorans]
MFEYQSSEISELAKALIAVQKSLQPAVKDATNPFVHNRYATLNSVMESCRDALLSNDIWMTQFPVPADPGYLGLVTKLTHAKSGQWQASLAVVPLPKADPQGMGSAMTYARRYSLSAMLGIVTDADDDGTGACATRPTTQTKTAPRQGARASMPSRHAQEKSSHGVPSPTSNGTKAATPTTTIPTSTLPKMDGITYQTVAADDGRTCVIAMGNTAAKKDMLAEIGFRWNPQRKVWWMYANAS